MAQTVQLDASREEQFEDHHALLRAIAFRLLGSLAASDAAVDAAREQLAQARLETGTDVRAWLVTATGATCLDALRSRETSAWHVPDLVVSTLAEHDSDDQVLLGGATGVALWIALDELTPEQRVAVVLHDDCDVPPAAIGTILGCSPSETERLLDEGRHQLRACPVPDADVVGQHKAVSAYLRAAKRGDLGATMGLLHENVRMRSDAGEHALSVVLSADVETVARRAVMLCRVPARIVPALVNGAAGFVVVGQKVLSVVAVTVVDGRIAEIDTLHDPERTSALNLPSFA